MDRNMFGVGAKDFEMSASILAMQNVQRQITIPICKHYITF